MLNIVAAAALATSGIANGAGAAALDKSSVRGDYVEARTCSVYTGACHANGEMVTTGREALLAWNLKSGEISGVPVAGLNVIAVVAGGENLAQETGERRSILYVDARATAAQREAIAAAFSRRYAKALGTIASVKSAPVTFQRSGLEYTVRVPGAAYLKTTRYACDHCVMPHEVWYEPLVGLKSSIVAKATLSEFKGAPELSTQWRRSDENSSFAGEFAF